MKGKLVLIDGNAILHRAFHALPPLTDKRGEPINAVYGLVSMLLRVIQDLKPTHIAVCFDEKEKTFRQFEFPKYQAQRPPLADDLSSQFAKARRVVQAFEIPIYSKPGFEADDVIGTIAEKAKEDVVIVTGDRDQLQLVDDKKSIKLYMPIAGLANAKLFGEAETKERMGVGPNLIDDYKALVGDPSDNYPGVPGIGPKTAVNLLEKYGSFENVYRNLDKIPEGTSKKLKEGEVSGKMSKHLATIVRDVPVDFDYEKMDKWDIDSPKVLDLFSEYGFKTLTERVKKVGKELDDQKQERLF
jgi:DNA polymerase-1